MNGKKLHINMAKETHLAFHLSALLTPELYPWFYERFVNIEILGDSQCYIEFIDNTIDYSYRELMEERIIYSYDRLCQREEDIITYLTESIENGFYSYIWVDKHYMPGSEDYMNWHFVHPVMVYGYDDRSKTISFVHFMSAKGTVLQEVSYDDFIRAFTNAEQYYEEGGGVMTLTETVTSFKPLTAHSNNIFELDRFMSELRDYLNSTVNIANLRRIYLNASEVRYGISVYDKLIDLAERFVQGTVDSIVPFKSFGDMCIHKDYICDRLAYIKDNYDIAADCRSKIEKFNEVADLWQSAKSLNIKYNIIDGNPPARLSQNPAFAAKFADILKEAQTKEKELLGYIFNSLKKYAIPKSRSINVVNSDDFYAEYCGYSRKVKIFLKKLQTIESIEILDSNVALNNDGTKRICFSDKTEVSVCGQQYNILHKNYISFKPKEIEWFEYSETNAENLCRDMKKLVFCLYKP